MKNKTSTITILAYNKVGVLYRILGLFRRKLFNIETLSAHHTKTPGTSVITLTTESDKRELDHICHQLEKMVDIISVKVSN